MASKITSRLNTCAWAVFKSPVRSHDIGNSHPRLRGWGFLLVSFTLLTILAGALPATAQPQEQESGCSALLGGRELVWAWNEWQPYAYRNAKNEVVGFDIELVTAILSRAGCPYRLVEMPAKRAQVAVMAGEVDLLAAASITDERAVYSYFSLPYRDERIALFAAADRASDFADMTLDVALAKGLSVVAGLGGWYGPTFDTHRDALLAAGFLTLTSDLSGRIRMVENGRADLLIEDRVAGVFTARQLGLEEKLALLPLPLYQDAVHLMLSRASVPPAVVALVNQAIQSSEKNSSFQLIVVGYTELNH